MPGDSGALRGLYTVVGVQVPAKDVRHAEDALNGIKKLAVGLAGVFAAGKLISGFRNIISSTAELGNSIAKASIRTGVAAETLRQWQYVAGLADVSNEALETSFKFMARNISEANKGSKEAQDVFARLGLSMDDLKGKTPDQVMLLAADAFSKLTDQSEKTSLAMKLFGKSGTQLLPLLKEGTNGIRKQLQEARDMGVAFSSVSEGATQEFIDNQQRLNTILTVLKETIGNALIPVINEASTMFIEWWKVNKDSLRLPLERFFEGMGNAIMFVGDMIIETMGWLASFALWFDENRGLGKFFLGLISAVIGLNVAMKLWGFAASVAQIAMSVFISNGMKQVIAFTGKMIASAATVAWGWVTSAATAAASWVSFSATVLTILAPLAIVLAAVTAIATAIYSLWNFFSGKENFLSKIGEWLGDKAFNIFNPNEPQDMGSVASTFGNQSPLISAATSPAASAQALGASSSVFNPQTSINVEVNATPGMSTEDVGNAAAQAIAKELEKTYRQTMTSLVPGV
jgi:hypothetical protein